MKIFITGISTDVGKTVVSTVITEALLADYWKPVQAGDLENTDTNRVMGLLSNSKSDFFSSAYTFATAASPHLAAEQEGVRIDINQIIEPQTTNHLVIEGAGGLLVPLNDEDCIIDLIRPDYKVILVSRHYLGSINHTLLSIELLRQRNISVSGIVFVGNEDVSTESIILKKTGIFFIGRINYEPYFDKNIITKYANSFRKSLISME